MREIIHNLRNNEIITGISILAVLQQCDRLSMAKAVLIEPLLSYQKVRYLLKHKKAKIRSIEELILKENISFADFSERYFDTLLLSLNAISLFHKMHLISIKEDEICFSASDFDFDTNFGGTTSERIQAAMKLAKILQKGEASDIYLSLRIKL